MAIPGRVGAGAFRAAGGGRGAPDQALGARTGGVAQSAAEAGRRPERGARGTRGV
jgi:hypothetical protein